MLIVAGFFLASCAATKTEQGGDTDAASASASSSSGGEITAGTQEDLIVNVGDRGFFEFDSSEKLTVYYRNVTMPNGEQGVGAQVKKNETNSD